MLLPPRRSLAAIENTNSSDTNAPTAAEIPDPPSGEPGPETTQTRPSDLPAGSDPYVSNAPPTVSLENESRHTDRESGSEASDREAFGWPDGIPGVFSFEDYPNMPFEALQELFTERGHNFFQQQASLSANQTSLQDTPGEGNAANSVNSANLANSANPTNSPVPVDSAGAPTTMNFLDEILDSVRTNRAAQDQDSQASQDSNTGAPGDTGVASVTGAIGIVPMGALLPGPDASLSNLGASGSVSNIDSATVFTTGALGVLRPRSPGRSQGDRLSAIIVTVNYMFSGGALNRSGRSGSLVVTIPDTPSNREPHVISLFITLATRMAYAALVNNAPKRKPGITLEEFRSFKRVDVDELTDKICSICFEEYEPLLPPTVDESILCKRRKMSPCVYVTSRSTTPEQIGLESAQVERDTPPSAQAGAALGEPSGNATGEATGGNNAQAKVYLCDHEEEFDHVPLRMPCKHVFGRPCIAQWLKESTNCPLCRLSVAEPAQPVRRRHTQSPRSGVRVDGGEGFVGRISIPSAGSSQQSRGNTSGNLSTSEQYSDEPDSDASESGQRSSIPPERSMDTPPGLVHRATQAIFHQPGRRHGDTPSAPLEAARRTPGMNRERNPSFSPVVYNLQNYLRRIRRRVPGASGAPTAPSSAYIPNVSGALGSAGSPVTQGDPGPRANAGTPAGAATPGLPGNQDGLVRPRSNSPFISGVFSLRTPNGIETVVSDAGPIVHLFGPFDRGVTVYHSTRMYPIDGHIFGEPANGSVSRPWAPPTREQDEDEDN